MLAAGGLLRASVSPFAPRVYVRWAPGVLEARRLEVERTFALVEGRLRADTTWEYDLSDLTPSRVLALVGHPDVLDTHYIDRVTGAVEQGAPTGTTRLAERRMAGWIYSPFFNWFLSFWVSSLAVSSLWLSAAADTPDGRKA